ncbi:hypothetical protein M8C21_030836, partial [Ambrosia artemisiifolia]
MLLSVVTRLCFIVAHLLLEHSISDPQSGLLDLKILFKILDPLSEPLDYKILWAGNKKAESLHEDGWMGDLHLLRFTRSLNFKPLADAYGLLMHRNGQWEWTLAPGVAPSSRYQHASVFVGARLHVTGSVVRGGRAVDGEAAVAVLDTAAGVWLDRHGLVTAPRGNKGQTEDPSLELMCRCRHAAASVGVRLYVYGGLRGEVLLGDFLVAENSPFQSDVSTPVLTTERGSNVSSPGTNNLSPFDPLSSDNGPQSPSSTGLSMDKESMEKLVEASAAEAEAANAVWQAAQAQAANVDASVADDNSQPVESCSEGSDGEGDVRLHPRAVVVAKEAVGNLGGLVRQLSLDQFENESRRMVPLQNDMSSSAKKFTRQKSPQGLHK